MKKTLTGDAAQEAMDAFNAREPIVIDGEWYLINKHEREFNSPLIEFDMEVVSSPSTPFIRDEMDMFDILDITPLVGEPFDVKPYQRELMKNIEGKGHIVMTFNSQGKTSQHIQDLWNEHQEQFKKLREKILIVDDEPHTKVMLSGMYGNSMNALTEALSESKPRSHFDPIPNDQPRNREHGWYNKFNKASKKK